MKVNYDQVTKQIEHHVEKGTAREEIIRKFLENYIPKKYSMKRGIIIDSNGLQSKQQDIFIVDNNVIPKFANIDSVDIVPVESVRVIIEVKSVLNTSELKKALINITSVRSMKKAIYNKNLVSHYPIGIIYAYESDITLDKIKSELCIYAAENLPTMPSLVVIQDKGYVTCADKYKPLNVELLPNQNTIFGVHNTDEQADNLMILYLIIIASLYMSNPNEIQPDIFQYAVNSGYISPAKKFVEDDYKGILIEMDGIKIDLDKVRTFQKEYMKLPQETRLSQEGTMMVIKNMKESILGLEIDDKDEKKAIDNRKEKKIIQLSGIVKNMNDI